jgi:predicted amidohydrolase
MRLDLWTFDVGVDAVTADEYAEACLSRVEKSWAEGADIVLFPEFCWLGLERFTPPDSGLRGVSDLFWENLWPMAQSRLSQKGKAVVLGSVPFWEPATLELRNRAPIIFDGQTLHQDKLHLTPWEDAFAPGQELRLWRFGGLTFVVIICLDIEVPELSVQLRGQGVDVILVPSATETVLGVERVDRCASARAVELACCVGVTHLTGGVDTESGLVGENFGRTAFYAPSQSAWAESPRIREGPVIDRGFQHFSCELDPAAWHHMHAAKSETNPSRIRANPKIPIGFI